MIVKMIGNFICFLSCTITGIFIKQFYKQKLKELKRILNGMQVFENEIRYSLNDMELVTERMSETLEGQAKKIFSCFNFKIKNSSGEPLSEIWTKTVMQSCSIGVFNKNEIDVLLKFGNVLGSGDVETQTKNIEYFISELENLIKINKDKEKNIGGISEKIGIYSGILIFILLL